MFLDPILVEAYLTKDPPTQDEILLLPAGVQTGIDQNMVVSRSTFETVMVNHRATEPASEAILMAIGKANGLGDPVWNTLLQNECVVSRYTELCNDYYVSKLNTLERQNRPAELPDVPIVGSGGDTVAGVRVQYQAFPGEGSAFVPPVMDEESAEGAASMQSEDAASSGLAGDEHQEVTPKISFVQEEAGEAEDAQQAGVPAGIDFGASVVMSPAGEQQDDNSLPLGIPAEALGPGFEPSAVFQPPVEPAKEEQAEQEEQGLSSLAELCAQAEGETFSAREPAFGFQPPLGGVVPAIGFSQEPAQEVHEEQQQEEQEVQPSFMPPLSGVSPAVGGNVEVDIPISGPVMEGVQEEQQQEVSETAFVPPMAEIPSPAESEPQAEEESEEVASKRLLAMSRVEDIMQDFENLCKQYGIERLCEVNNTTLAQFMSDVCNNVPEVFDCLGTWTPGQGVYSSGAEEEIIRTIRTAASIAAESTDYEKVQSILFPLMQLIYEE